MFSRFPHMEKPKYKERLKSIFAGGPPTIFSSQLHKYIIPIERPVGNFRTQHTTVTAVPGECRTEFFALFSIQDVTDLTRLNEGYRILRDQALEEVKVRKETEASLRKSKNLYQSLTEELQRANAELENFTYSVSHDLRTPLRAINGFSEILQEDYADQLDATAVDYLKRITRGASRMDTLIADLLRYSRLSAGELTLNLESLESIVANAVSQVDAELDRTKIDLHIEPELPTVMSDAAILTQVVANLLANAAKFGPQGTKGEIKVWAEGDDDWVRLWVADNGIGIAPEHQQRIFKIFQRLHDDKAYPGTGIGLAIVHKGISRLGGRLGVESIPNEGSKFWIDLPRNRTPSCKHFLP